MYLTVHPLVIYRITSSIHASESARLSVYKMFVCREVVAHRQLRYVVGEREQKGLNYTLHVVFYVGFRNFRKTQH